MVGGGRATNIALKGKGIGIKIPGYPKSFLPNKIYGMECLETSKLYRFQIDLQILRNNIEEQIIIGCDITYNRNGFESVVFCITE